MKENDVSFSKEEHLKGEKIIENLFYKGRSFSCYPLKAVWMFRESDSDSPLKLLVAVPKKNFKNAVDRNLLKRRIKESFRLNKSILLKSNILQHRNLLLAIVYTASATMPFSEIQQKIIVILKRLSVENEKTTG